MSSVRCGWSSPLSILVLLFLSLSKPASATQDTDKVQHLLSTMSSAIRELSYRGLFTYEYGGSLDTLKVIHTVKDGVEYERLQQLNGPEREFLRSGQSIKCLPPGDQLLRGRLLHIGEKVETYKNHYHFYLRGTERIAGRQAITLQVVPRDNFRYGYTLAIDRETGLPLRSLLVGSDQRVLERFQFVELDIGEIDDQELQPVYQQPFVADHQLSDCSRSKPSTPSHWLAQWLPAGFMFTGQSKTDNDGDMLMYTDGLTAFSVFIDPVADKVLVEGKAHRGGTVAVMSRVIKQQQAFSVTVVGEIPPLTAQRVAASIKPVP